MKRQNQLAEFNEAFKDIVDRGVFKELSPQEIDDWQGPVNLSVLQNNYGQAVAFRGQIEKAEPTRRI